MMQSLYGICASLWIIYFVQCMVLFWSRKEHYMLVFKTPSLAHEDCERERLGAPDDDPLDETGAPPLAWYLSYSSLILWKGYNG
jgi:hypothetical protein